MPHPRRDLPELPTEIILIILDKSKELLDSDVKTYVSHHKDVELAGFPNHEAREHYYLFHERLGFDDCVFWHQCWAYTALRLVNRFIGGHASKWANVEYVDEQIRLCEDEYDQQHPEHRGLERYRTYTDPTSPLAHITARQIPDPEGRSKILWMRRGDVVPQWAKFMEAHALLPEGTQMLPWQSGYDKATAYCCIHFDKNKLALLLETPSLQARPRSARNDRLSYFPHLLDSSYSRFRRGQPGPIHPAGQPPAPVQVPAPAGQTAPAQTLPQASQQQQQSSAQVPAPVAQPGLPQSFHQTAQLPQSVQLMALAFSNV